jgi:hypothetical protein
MKHVIFALMCFVISAVSAQDSLTLKKEKNFRWSVEGKIEYNPYAPLSAQTLSEGPVVIAVANAKWKRFASFSYWKSFDFYGKTGGDYNGLFSDFTIFTKKKTTILLRSAHFFDYRFQGNYISVVGVKLKVGNFSVTPMQQLFGQRKPRQIVMTTFTHKGFGFSNWVIREKGEISTLFGVSWNSGPLTLPGKYDVAINVVYNRRLAGEFGANEVKSIGLMFSPDIKK